MACTTAVQLGKALQENKCKLYYGFDQSSHYVDDVDAYIQNLFIKAHNYALKLICSGITDPNEIINKTVELHFEIIDEIRYVYPTLHHRLRENLDRIVIYTPEGEFRRT